jgi:hypothetical protein
MDDAKRLESSMNSTMYQVTDPLLDCIISEVIIAGCIRNVTYLDPVLPKNFDNSVKFNTGFSVLKIWFVSYFGSLVCTGTGCLIDKELF